jgi:glycosyltransferase involved in cell wall biosynthesis
LKRFDAANEDSRRAMRQKLNIEDRFALVYVGSFGGWYLTPETADFYGELKRRRSDAFALILTQSKPEMIEPLLREKGFSDGDFFIQKVAPVEIPLYLSAADAAVSFIKPCYSKQASSPTKNAEYLACGLPLVVNGGIGDTTELTKADDTGVVIENFSTEGYQNALAELDKMLEDKEVLAGKCRASARKRFDLFNVGGERYRRLYRNLLQR